jgi:hypothetical protein
MKHDGTTYGIAAFLCFTGKCRSGFLQEPFFERLEKESDKKQRPHGKSIPGETLKAGKLALLELGPLRSDARAVDCPGAGLVMQPSDRRCSHGCFPSDSSS